MWGAFAFGFVTDVLYNKSSYYAYKEMDCKLSWWQRGRVRSVRHLMFRLANYRQPKTLYCVGVDKVLCEACQYGVQGLTILRNDEVDAADMILTGIDDESAMKHVGEGTMVVVHGIHRGRDFWKRVRDDERITVTFDLHDVGIAFARKDLNKQHYMINW